MSSSLPLGTRLGRYEIRSKIGEGGMGEVYLARDTELDRTVALKILPEDLASNQQRLQRFTQEAKAASALNHPHILTIYEIGTTGNSRFIATEFIDGETLRHRIGAGMKLADILETAIQIAGALAAAHAAGIVHRDIKPENIMLRRDSIVKVLDFGLAKLTERVSPESVDTEAVTRANIKTDPGVVMGTAIYMSPEQARGLTVDGRTDIFSLGVVIYEMLAGRLPFAGSSKYEIIASILSDKESSPISSTREVPAELERIIAKALRKNRNERYQTIKDLLLDLQTLKQELEFQKKLERSASVARRLNPGAPFFRHSRESPTVSIKPVNSAAYDYYLRGKLNLGSLNRENNESATTLLEQAVNADPSFAPAYAELARAYCMKASLFAPEAERKRLNEDAKVAVEKALALNPDLAEGHCIRGYVLWTHANRFPHEQAIQCYKRAIALDPNLEEAHDELGAVYLHIGLLDKTEEELKKVLAINPSDTLARLGLGLINMYRAKHEEALDVLKTVPREANPWMVDSATAITLLQLGRTQEASEVMEDYLKTYATDAGGIMTSFKAMLLAKAGKGPEAEETIQRAVKIGKGFQHFHHTTYNIASAYTLLNKPDQALKWLQFTADDGFPCYPLFENDANLNSLRKDERFIAFMAKLKRQWERYQATL